MQNIMVFLYSSIIHQDRKTVSYRDRCGVRIFAKDLSIMCLMQKTCAVVTHDQAPEQVL